MLLAVAAAYELWIRGLCVRQPGVSGCLACPWCLVYTVLLVVAQLLARQGNGTVFNQAEKSCTSGAFGRLCLKWDSNALGTSCSTGVALSYALLSRGAASRRLIPLADSDIGCCMRVLAKTIQFSKINTTVSTTLRIH